MAEIKSGIETDDTDLGNDISPNNLTIKLPEGTPKVVVSTPIVEPTPAPESTATIAPEVVVPEVEQIEIDGVLFNLDKDGNALNTDNTIKMSKGEIDTLSANSNTQSLDMTDLMNRVNIVPVDNAGTPIAYDSTVDGMASYVRDSVDILAQQKIEQGLNEYFTSNPSLAYAKEYIERYGSLEGINTNVDYSNVDVTLADENTKVNMIIAREMAKGETIEEAKAIAKLHKDAGNLDSRAATAKTYFVAEAAERNAELAKQQVIQQEEANKYWNEIDNKLTNRKLTIGSESLVIPEALKVINSDGTSVFKSIDDFKNYISIPIPFEIDGIKYKDTAYQRDVLIKQNNESGIDQNLFEALKMFTKNGAEQFIRDTKKAKEIRAIRTNSSNSDKGNPKPVGTTVKIVTGKRD